MTEHTHCQQPDRDCPDMVCGYPLPCPFHTIELSLPKPPAVPVVKCPIPINRATKDAIDNIADALQETANEA